MSESEQLPDSIETIPEGLAYWAERTPAAPAVRSVIDGDWLSHGELHEAVVRAARRLWILGIRGDDLVALSVRGGNDAPVALLAAITAAIAAPFNPAATGHELTRDLERLRPRILVTDAPAAGVSHQVTADLGIVTIPVGDLVAAADTRAAQAARLLSAHPDRIAAILHTSGTTGMPKRIPRNHRSFLAATRAVRHSSALTPKDSALLVSGVCTNAGLRNALFALLTGGSCVIAPRLDPAQYPDWLAAYRPTWTYLNATDLNLILEAADK